MLNHRKRDMYLISNWPSGSRGKSPPSTDKTPNGENIPLAQKQKQIKLKHRYEGRVFFLNRTIYSL